MPGRLFLPRWRVKGEVEYRTCKVWWWEIPDGHGGKIKGSTKVSGGKPGKPPKEAQLILAEKLAEHGRGMLSGPVKWEDVARMVMADQKARGLKSVGSTEDRLAHVTAYFQGVKVHEMTPSRITAYAAHRRAQDASVATINHELTLMGQGFNLALRDGLIARRPQFRTLPGANIRQGFVGDGEFSAILGKMSEHCADAVLFLRLTGWRAREPLKLTWPAVDWEHACVRIEADQTKKEYARTFPLYPPLRALMEKRLSEHKRLQTVWRFVPWVFCDPAGNQLTLSRVYSQWVRARVRFGSRKTLHDLRRTFVREARLRGMAPTTIMELGGWRSMSMLKRYSISDLTSLSQEVTVLTGPDLQAGQIKLFSEGAK